MVWSVSDVNAGVEQFLYLCQNKNGFRFFKLGWHDDNFPQDDVILKSTVVTVDLLLSRNLKKISNQILLSNGEPFFVDAHGTWLTKDECAQIDKTGSLKNVKWVTGVAPNFAQA